MKKYFLILLIIFLSFFRFVWLDKFPVGLDHDEVMYSLNGASYLYTGKDLSGVSFPLSVFRTATEGTASIVPSLFLSFYYRFVEVNQFNVRLFYAFFALATTITIFFLTKSLFKKSEIAFLSCIMFLANPWSFDLFRWCSDAPLALFFYLSGITIFIRAHSKRAFLLSFLMFILGFFSYQGAKPILLPIIVVIILFRRFIWIDRINNLQSIIFAFVSIIFFCLYFLLDFLLPGKFASGRLDEVFLLNKPFLSSVVDQQRKKSIQNPFDFIYSNKFTASLNTFTNKYLTAFSSDVLFVSGDPRATYKFGSHGLFNYYDILLIPLGFIYLFYAFRKVFYLLGGLILLAPIPTAINIVETSVVNRSFMLQPLLIILSALGTYKIFIYLSKKLNLKASLMIITLFVLFFFGNFLHFYFFRYPILSQEGNFFSERLVAKYIQLNYKKSKSIDVYTALPQTVFNEMLFFNFNDFGKNFFIGNHQVNNVNFLPGCPKTQPMGVTLIDSRLNCQINKKENTISINDPKDNGSLYSIYNDQLCQRETLDIYKRFHNISDYDFTQMSDSGFCKNWVMLNQY